MLIVCNSQPPLTFDGKRFPHRLHVLNIAENVASEFFFHIAKVQKVDGNSSSISMADVMIAADNCVAVGANIISLAISCLQDASGGGCYKPQWKRQFSEIYNQGILIIGSAGNTGNKSMEFPGAYETVVSVSAVNQRRAWYENGTWNDQVEIAAPGV